MTGIRDGQIERRRRLATPVARVAIASGVGLALLTASTVVLAQDSSDVGLFVAVFDDPTSLARDIDARVSSVIADCMKVQDQPYEISADAQFDLSELTLEEAFTLGIERSFGDLVPHLVEPADLAIDPENAFVDPSVLVTPDLLIDPQLVLDVELVPELTLDEDLYEPRLTDVTVRLEPKIEGYSVALEGYDLVQPNPNLTVVEDLSVPDLEQYEIAFYGEPLTDLAAGETGGCAEQAFEVLLSEVIPALTERDEELLTLEQQILADSGFKTSLEEWSSCVASSGIEGAAGLETLDDAVSLTQTRFAAIDGDLVGLREVQDFERELATVDFDCRARSTDLAVAAVVARSGLPYVSGVEALSARLQEGS